jgi:hypothetical protein
MWPFKGRLRRLSSPNSLPKEVQKPLFTACALFHFDPGQVCCWSPLLEAFPFPEAGRWGRPAEVEQIASLFNVNPVSTVIAEHALAHGIETDKYDVPDVNMMDRSHAGFFF